MGGAPWLQQGFDGINKEEQRLAEQYGPHRFWIKGGDSKDLVWVDDDTACIYEHNPKIGGSYMNWFTCLEGVYDEVVCCQKLGPKSRTYVGYLTGVDCTAWQDQRGNTHQYEMRLVPLKLRSLKKFRRKKEDRGSMVGTMWKMNREDDNAASVGDDWDFVRDVDMKKMFDVVCYRGKKLEEIWQEAEKDAEAMVRLQRTFKIEPGEDGKLLRIVPPFNYFKILEPKTPKELRLLLGAVELDEKKPGKSGKGAAQEDNVPF